MKNLMIILMSLIVGFTFSGCGSIGVKPVQPCIVDFPTDDGRIEKIEFNVLCDKILAEGRESYICNLRESHQFDACYIHRAMEVVVKEGLVMEGYTAEEFEQWGEYIKGRVEAGLSYGILKDLMLAQFTKFNKLLGAQVLILGDMFLELPQDTLMPRDDAIMVASSIDDLVQEVKNLDIWLN
jgi:hypothetical protein